MNNEELSTQHRNLLIAIAKSQTAAAKKSVLLRNEADREQDTGRRSGLYCLSRAYSKHAHLLELMLHKNSIALRQFFKTTNPETISKKEILLTHRRRVNTVTPASKSKPKQP